MLTVPPTNKPEAQDQVTIPAARRLPAPTSNPTANNTGKNPQPKPAWATQAYPCMDCGSWEHKDGCHPWNNRRYNFSNPVYPYISMENLHLRPRTALLLGKEHQT
ncbi:hypothetical protein NA56DRAFT_747545 [Hyaloscypha hepaticicola]|uniref:Uncharacterized protein n=1 Tax=Hyaloscypha hepaticicola TaxID=2082293 RepID=A0A2J6Q9I5_9HELO|nr:hypothetical protein NA56DRAFT_747545 [Hyaloscypha hepaticicola]